MKKKITGCSFHCLSNGSTSHSVVTGCERSGEFKGGWTTDLQLKSSEAFDMTSVTTVEPHGGTLIDLLVDEERAALLRDIALSLPDITLNDRQLCDLELLATGAFSPLTGFMDRSDYESVLDRMRLQNGILWPIPICLDVEELKARSLEGLLRSLQGSLGSGHLGQVA